MINKLFLDLNNFKPNLGSVERGDSIELNIKLLNDEDYSRSKFRLLGAKSDGKSVEQIEGLNLEEKDLKVVLEDQFVNCEGIVKLELNVVSGETEITTKEFYFFVSNTMNGEIVESSDSVPTLEKVSKYVDDAVNNLDALKEASADIALINGEFKENEIKRKANEMLREKNEKARLQSEDIRITEEEERVANELERIKAENNRKVSESNRKVSENTRVTNERAREEAELSRQSTFEENEEIRNSNENLRIESEKERIKFNNKAKTDEVNRKEAETKRVEAEKTRVIAEDERKKAETSRQEAEDIRQNTYTNFNEAEEERRNNEISRQEAEALRIEAEKRRDDLYSQKEEERNAAFLESERTRGTAFNEAQNDRNLTFEESEAIREEAFKVSEAARNEAEEVRKETELSRVEAENNRKVAESKRVKAESARVEAEKLRVAAETERVEAENLRVTAEEGRVEAETKREEGFNAFEGKINANTEELKNARSATTGEKFDTLDERIDCEVDRLNKKIEVSMLQQEDKESHMIENTVEGMTTDMIVKGRTLQNVMPELNKSNFNFTGETNLVDGFFVIPFGVDVNASLIGVNRKKTILKPSTKYTVIADILENNTGQKLGMSSYGCSFVPSKNSFDNSVGISMITGTTKDNFNDVEIKTDFLFCIWGNGGDLSKKIKFKAMVLEGDWTNKPIPKYFDSIKSFGQQEDKISILSQNTKIPNEVDFRIEKIYTDNNVDYNTLVFSNNSNISGKISINKLVNRDAHRLRIYGLNEKPLNNTMSEILSKKIWDSGDTFNTSLEFNLRSCNYLVIIGYSLFQNDFDKNYKITFNINKKQDKKDILLSELGFDEGLRGLTVCDELNDIRNVAIKRIEKIIINGNSDNGNNYIYYSDKRFIINIPSLNINKKDRAYVLCDKLPYNYSAYSTIGQYGISGYGDSSATFVGRWDLGETVTDRATFIEYLKTNPITVYYELAEPIEIDLNTEMNTKVYLSKTYVSFENSISCTSSFKAPVNTVATIARLNRENRALEEENKNLKQDFESTTLTLIDSDLELVKQNVDMDFRLMEVEFALDIPQAILSSNINFKNKKGEVKNMARSPYEMMKIVILSGDYDREDYMYKVGKYYERGRMTKEEHDELISLMTADEVISK
ncbi:hypothetical protein [Clostridium perfringens]|uniref:hypothetical protein n=1 Tax=Clostridium perfringens TaxID=1502 RepID=UPI002A3062EE|nr:hypothetical protein [Clostridium perfringens]MDK0582019.1 hypothetical protein [Clostridium perfringens]